MNKKAQSIVYPLFILFLFNLIYFVAIAGYVQQMGMAAYTTEDNLLAWFAGNLNLIIIGFDLIAVFAILRFG